jgi:hypothetical protein
VASSAITGALSSIYFDRTFFEESTGYIEAVFSEIFAETPLESWLEVFVTLHFPVFVVLFVLIDGVFAYWSHEKVDRDRFGRILLILDAPLLIAVILVTYIKVRIRDKDEAFRAGAEYFEAGAVSFQLIVGCFVAYFLELTEMASIAQNSPPGAVAQTSATPPENPAEEAEN